MHKERIHNLTHPKTQEIFTDPRKHMEHYVTYVIYQAQRLNLDLNKKEHRTKIFFNVLGYSQAFRVLGLLSEQEYEKLFEKLATFLNYEPDKKTHTVH